MATQNVEPDVQTHTLRIIEGGNAQHCLLSLGCLTIIECKVPTVIFFVGREGGNSTDLSLIIRAYEIISPPYNVSMKGVFKTDRHVFHPAARGDREFIITNYNTSSRKGWIQIPKYYLPQILERLK